MRRDVRERVEAEVLKYWRELLQALEPRAGSSQEASGGAESPPPVADDPPSHPRGQSGDASMPPSRGTRGAA